MTRKIKFLLVDIISTYITIIRNNNTYLLYIIKYLKI